MPRYLPACLAIGLLVGISGCGGPDRLIKKQIALMNEHADAIEKKDAVKFQRTINEMKEIQQQIKDLNLSPEEMERLKEKYKGDLERAMQRIHEAAEKQPDFMKHVDPTPQKGK